MPERPIHEDEIRNPHVRYERRVFNARLVLLFGFVMIVLAVLLHFTVAGIFNYFKQHYAMEDPRPNPIMSAEPARKPPAPHLQPDPVADLSKFRGLEDDVLQTYGWVDKNAGVVRIPVSRALQLAATRGIPGLQGTSANQQATPRQTSAPATQQHPAAKGKQ
jgi:hypothetical protein